MVWDRASLDKQRTTTRDCCIGTSVLEFRCGKISQLQIDNAGGTLAPVSVDKTNVFVIADGYFPHLGLDPTNNTLLIGLTCLRE